MRTAPSRFRRLVGLLVVAVSVGWLLLRRWSDSVRPLAAMAPPGTPPVAPTPPVPPAAMAPGTPPVAVIPPVPLTPPGPAVEAGPPAAPDVLATDAGLTVEPAAPASEPVEPPAPDLLATDAGLTPAGSADDTMVLPQVVAVDEPAPTGTDDLRAIRGVGPAIERTLHELGVTTYQQVADLRGEQLEAVRQRLEAFSARIEREDWTGQARELHRRKYGD